MGAAQALTAVAPVHSMIMCTVIVEVPDAPRDATRLLAIRDEDPARPWDPPGEWWPERPGVVGVRDRRAGGAWLATWGAHGKLSVVLNRAENTPSGLPAGPNGLQSRGSIVLDDVAGRPPSSSPGTANFNLISVHGGLVTATSWDGESLFHEQLTPGIHMIAHHGVDDPCSARIETWLPEFRALAGVGDNWRELWIELLTRTTALPAGDDRAIIRDNRPHGYPTMSLLACVAEVRATGGVEAGGSVHLETAVLEEAAVWNNPGFVPSGL